MFNITFLQNWKSNLKYIDKKYLFASRKTCFLFQYSLSGRQYPSSPFILQVRTNQIRIQTLYIHSVSVPVMHCQILAKYLYFYYINKTFHEYFRKRASAHEDNKGLSANTIKACFKAPSRTCVCNSGTFYFLNIRQRQSI